MVFTTLKFILFMAAVFFLYYSIPHKHRWQLLLAASYVFYASASPLYLSFLLFTTVVTYVGAVMMDGNYAAQKAWLREQGKELAKEEKKQYKERTQRKQKCILWVVIVLLLVMLGIFKYLNFALQSVSWVLGVFGMTVQFPTLNLLLPLGLSFYMFQSMGYCIDVYREAFPAERNFGKHALFVSFFPQLLQGPIGDYGRLAPQLFAEHPFAYENAKAGLQRVAWGFFKKLIIANQLSMVVNEAIYGYRRYTGFAMWAFALVAYAFQLYADFSGYMDIANGCAQMLGITMDENFNAPYLSKTTSEYWRRWHATLGAWFKNYVFYPLLRTDAFSAIRKKYRKTHPHVATALPNAIALFIVWFLLGLWHGADWSYVVFDLYHGAFLILASVLAPVYTACRNRCGRLCESRAFHAFQILRTFVIVCIGYAFFAPANLATTAEIFSRMCAGSGISDAVRFAGLFRKELAQAAIGICVLVPVDVFHYYRPEQSLRDRINALPTWQRWMIYTLGLLLIFVIGAYGKPDLNQFAYFKF